MDTNFTAKLEYFLKLADLHKAHSKILELVSISECHFNCNKKAVGALISITAIQSNDFVINLLKSHAKVLLTANL